MPAPEPYALPSDFGAPEKRPIEHLVRQPTPPVVRRWKSGNTAGKTVFVALRSANPLLQYLIYTQGWGNKLYALLGLTAATPHIGLLSPKQKLLVGIAAVGAARQIFWCLYINESPITVLDATHITLFNLVADTANTLLSFTCSAWSLGIQQLVGSAMVAVGSVIETGSELQRKWFKAKPENTGRVIRNGLWKYSRHVNYAGYVLWRGGYAMSPGNVYAFWNPLVHLWDFSARGIPVLERYMSLKYKDEWAQYSQHTPYKLIPYVW
ncbi:hypothetical protein DFJ77DRAFT_462409 [Powellomyces hirtus]|nr:hypothetical protein DFJ77DRAFT_462409 [Powellomyces hirtus]